MVNTSPIELLLQLGPVPLLVEPVRQGEVVDGVGLVAAAAPQLEQEVAGLAFRVGHHLDEEDVADLDGDLTEELLALEQLDQRDPLIVLLEVPVQVLLVEQGAVGGSRPQYAVRVALEPAPEPIEGERGTGLDGDGHDLEYSGGRGAVGPLGASGGARSGAMPRPRAARHPLPAGRPARAAPGGRVRHRPRGAAGP